MSAIVLIEAIFAVCFATIQDRSIKNADERVNTQTLITHLNLVSLLWCSAAANSFQHMAQNKGTETGTLVRYRTQIKNEFQQIQPLLDGESERRPIAELEKAMQDTIALLTGLQQCWPYNDRRFFESVKEVQLMIERMSKISQTLITGLLSVEAGDRRQQLSNERQLQAALIGGLGLNLIFIVAVGSLFADRIVGKLSVIGENSKRLAEGRVLQPATPGSDELAVLDQEFHRMADSIVAARIKARTAVDNSLDLIFSLASDGTFRSVNPAALKILGFKPTELLNRSYIDIVKKQDRERVVEQLKLARAGKPIAAIEHTAIRKGSDEVELQLTAQWSTEDQSLFCVVHDVSEQHRLKRQREEFTENITRALREPLHSLTASLSALRNSELTGEQEREQLQSARSSAQPVLNLISNLLQLEKIQAGMIKLSLSKEPISALIEDATESLVDAAELNDVAINWQAGDQIVNVDGQAIHDVLVALVKNAIANSPPRGQINIESFYDGMVVIQITDNGPKWTIDDFDPFALAKKANTGETEGKQRKHQGTNLELAICKTSVEAHKGSITIGSDSIAAASISIRLPGFESTSGEKA